MKNTLEISLVRICKENFDNTNDWYNWRKINESLIPQGITLPIGNQYIKNIKLKEELNSKWNEETDPLKKGELIEYYIKTWGGIKGNKAASLEEYKTKTAEELISKGIKGVASWSKALVLHDYTKYAIFDARVSSSLNALQVINDSDNKVLFPILSSQNKRIIIANRQLKKMAKESGWKKADESSFYNEYLNLLSTVSKGLNTNISTVEMLLFAKAEQLIENASLL